MDRLKTLGGWVIIVIAFYLFSNGLIYLCLNGMNNDRIKNEIKNEMSNNQVINNEQ